MKKFLKKYGYILLVVVIAGGVLYRFPGFQGITTMIRMTTACAPTVPWQGSKKSVGKQGCCIWKMPGTGAAMTIG